MSNFDLPRGERTRLVRRVWAAAGLALFCAAWVSKGLGGEGVLTNLLFLGAVVSAGVMVWAGRKT